MVCVLQRKSKTPTKDDEKETMVENDVKEQVDGVKDADDSQAESAAEQQTNGDDAHEVADKVTDNGETETTAEPAPTEAPSDPVEPAAEKPEKPVEEKTEEPERNTPTESVENSTNNSV